MNRNLHYCFKATPDCKSNVINALEIAKMMSLSSLFSFLLLFVSLVHGQYSIQYRVSLAVFLGQERGSLRLIRFGEYSPRHTSGRLQVYLNNNWGSVCGHPSSSPFSVEAATVSCRQLGYQGARSFSRAAGDK